jgi:hypothetical protein
MDGISGIFPYHLSRRVHSVLTSPTGFHNTLCFAHTPRDFSNGRSPLDHLPLDLDCHMARVSTTRYLTTAVAGGLALLLCAAYIFPAVPLWPNYGRSPAHGNTADNGIKSTDPMTDVARDAKMTRFLAHQPGFSVIENL